MKESSAKQRVSQQSTTAKAAPSAGPGGFAVVPPQNRTGLPDELKAGVESLSGLSLDNVRVHYNSSKPVEVQALAYTQGRDIHVAPGQERHVPHEAWHAVQQMQGRVVPTTQIEGGANINEDARLEKEADTMGEKVLGEGRLEIYLGGIADSSRNNTCPEHINGSRMPIQRTVAYDVNLVAAHGGTIVNAITASLTAVPDGLGGIINLINDHRFNINFYVVNRRDPNPANVSWFFHTAAGGFNGGLQPVDVQVDVEISNWFLRQEPGLVISEFNHELGVHFIPFLGPILTMWNIAPFVTLVANDFHTVQNLSNNNADHLAASTIGNPNFQDYQGQVIRAANFLVQIGDVEAARSMLFGYLMDISSMDATGARITNPLMNAGWVSNRYAVYWNNLNGVIGGAAAAMPQPTISRLRVIWEYAKLIPPLIRMVFNP